VRGWFEQSANYILRYVDPVAGPGLKNPSLNLEREKMQETRKKEWESVCQRVCVRECVSERERERERSRNWDEGKIKFFW